MAQQPNLSKLMFRIVKCSGEEPDYPVSELLTQSPQSKGWQSPKYCEYPQEITLQFLNPVKVRQVQFLSHQCKIPTKVELYIYMPDLQIPANNREIKYKKLGYLSLDSNERSQFQARELKSVYIESPCHYLKLIFQKCHINKYNLFNQIGIIALSVFGESINGSQSQQQKPKEYFNDIQYETQMDYTTLEKMRQLERAKESAVKNEDFLEAKRLKEAIDRLKQVGTQLRQLEDRKTVAIQNEDYDSANIIKKEIDKLRSAIAPDSLVKNQNQRPNQQNIFPHQYPDEGNDYGEQQSQIQRHQQPSYMQPVQQPQQSQKQLQQQQQQQQEYQYNQNDGYANEGEGLPQHSQFFNEEQKIQPDPPKKKNNNNNNIKPKSDKFDDQVIPTLANKNNEDRNENEFDDNNANGNVKVDNLSVENAKFADPLIPILTEDCVQMLFSKSWATKEEGLKFLEAQINKPTKVDSSDLQTLITSIMGAVSFTISDRIAAVYARSMSLLQALLKKHSKVKINKRGDFTEYSDNVIQVKEQDYINFQQGVMEKLGDTNARTKEQAENAMIQMAEHPSIGSALCVNHLIKGFQSKPKLESSIKHIVGRLGVILQYILRFQINNPNMPYQPIVDFTVKQIDHNNDSVRTAAIQVMVEIYRCVGEKLRSQMGNIRPAQMEILERAFQDIEGGGTGESVVQQPQVVVSTNIDTNGPNSKAKNSNKKGTKEPQGKQKDKVQQEVVDTSALCEFCDQVDKEFRDSNKHDIHLWRECPMLITCTQCAQVVEISSYTQHLLEECEQHKSFKLHSRCKEAINVSNYDYHIQENNCQIAKPPAQANRCPLCHTDIKPGLQGWKFHLNTQGCPNNERSAG